MGLEDKASRAAENLRGKAKEAAGRLTDDSELRGEGAADQVSGKVKDAVEKAKQAANEVRDKLTGK